MGAHDFGDHTVFTKGDSEERGRLAEGVQLSHEKQVELAQILKDKGYSNTAIANIMRINESSVRTLLDQPDKINWGYNCLTQGIHHGRPEPIWNIPLLQALAMFDTRDLKQLVVARIHTDALIFVHRGENPPTEEWAQRVADLAAEKFDAVFAAKLKELETYYDSPEWYRDIRATIERVKDNRLNQRHHPLHSHDSINMLCRIIGTTCSIEASR